MVKQIDYFDCMNANGLIRRWYKHIMFLCRCNVLLMTRLWDASREPDHTSRIRQNEPKLLHKVLKHTERKSELPNVGSFNFDSEGHNVS